MELDFVKFFDVKAPIGTYDNPKAGEFSPVGVDLYFPQPTIEFFEALVKSNENLKISSLGNLKNKVDIIEKSTGKPVLIFTNEQGGLYRIFKKIQIPTGIGLLIPNGYHIDLRSKSSNFKNEYSSVTGLIDADYTYGMGAQIFSFDTECRFTTNEKFVQIVLQKTYFIEKMNEITLIDWNQDSRVLNRRETRQGGFGHSGKY